MLLIDIYRYLKRRADKRPVYLKNFVDQSHHHGTRVSEPSVEIVIPTRDKVDLLRACVESIFENTTYKNYRVTIVDNQSVELATHVYVAELEDRGVKILKYPHKFNYAEICNQAAASTGAKYLCFLNNDTEVVEPDWLGYLVDHAEERDVGAVGSKLIFQDGSIQHLGAVIGLGGVAGHYSPPSITNTIQSPMPMQCFQAEATTFACVLVRKDLYEAIGGLDKKYRVGLNDIEFCLKLRLLGMAVVICTCSSLIHHESSSRRKATSLRAAPRAIIEILELIKGDKYRLTDNYFDRLR